MLKPACFLALAMLACACGDSTRKVVDADTDAPGGSANVWSGLDPSPKDHDLEIGVLAISIVVAGGPIGVRHRRRRTRQL